MMRQGNTLSFLGEKDLFDYHDFLVPRGKEGLFYPALVEHLASRPWDQVRLFSIPEGSPTLSHLPPLAESRGWRCQVTQEDVAPGLELPQTWDQYLMSLSKKDRHELRRKLRRMAGLGQPAHRVCETGRDVAASIEAFLTLMRESRKEKHRFLTPEREGFFRAVAAALAAQGVLHLHLLELGGRQAAAVLCFDYRESRLLYNSGYDTAYGALSAGLLLKAECLREAIEKGLSYYDFLRGAEPYKYDLGARDRLLYSITLSR
jgi:CelD/BcsL family acetyltransferase involved in cellulose biosynthesis